MDREIIKIYPYSILSNSNILSYLIFSLGFLTPFPIYFDLKTLKPFLIEFDPSLIAINSESSLPISIGVFSISLYLLIVLIRTKSFNYLIRNIIFLTIIMFPILRGFDFIRIPIIMSPIIYLIIITRFLKVRYTPKDGFSIGYIIGLLAVYIVNIISFLGFSILDTFTIDIQYVRQIFGYEIWQYYITYSAIASLVFGVITLYLLNNYSSIFKIKNLLLSVSFFALIASILPLRKAALLDFALVTFLIFLKFIIDLKNFKINKNRVILFLFTLALSIFAFLFTISSRNLTFESSYIDRLEAIQIAFNVLNLNIFEILFGFESGFGGYSNLFLELFVRNGLFGFLIYLFVFGIFARNYYLALNNYQGISRFKNNNIFVFILFSVFIGNFVNLNFATPYYVTNFASIIITFNSLDLVSRINRL